MRTYAASAAATLLVGFLLLLRPGLMKPIDLRVEDSLQRWAGPGRPSGRVAIVEIDERSLARLGRWPWPRAAMGSLVQALSQAGAATVVLDMMFAEPDRGGNDRAFAAAMGASRVLVGHTFTFSAASDPSACVLHPAPLAFVHYGAARQDGLFRASGVICTLPLIAAAASGSGHLNAAPDSDGILRRAPLLIEFGGQAYPSLAVAAVMTHDRLSSLRYETGGTAGAALFLGPLPVPLESAASLRLRFLGARGTLPRVSAIDVLEQRPAAAFLRGKLAIVGGSALGMQDAVATPVDGLMPGVEVQATVIDNLLAGNFFQRPASAPFWESALLIAAAALSSAALGWLRPLAGAAVALSGAVFTWLLCAWICATSSTVISPLPASAAVLVSLPLMGSARLIEERRRAARQSAEARRFLLTALSSLTALRDHETGAHSQRVQHYMQLLCDALATHRRFRTFLNAPTRALLVQLSSMHDIGKIGLPDSILRKPGHLTPDEFAMAKLHVQFGREVIERAAADSGLRDPLLLGIARDLISAHHERWNGAGYPLGLKGDAIPIAGRLLAVVDTYDAVVSERIYKPALAHEEAVRIIGNGRDSLYDPDIVDAFLRGHSDWRRIACQYPDSGPALSTSAAAAGDDGA